jgi:hypothetical protein
MRTRLMLYAAILVIACSFTLPPDCGNLIFFKEGTKTTMSHYNDDGKLVGTTKTVYKKVEKSGAAVTVNAVSENYDKKGKLATTSDFTIKCVNGLLSFDLRSMLPQQQAEAYKDFEVTVDGIEKEFPSDFQIGSTLKDSEVKFSFKTKGGSPMPMMSMSVWVTNRKVEGKESITTAAGTFECYKMTEDVEMKTLFKIKAKTTSWFSKEAGVVKTESFKENGKPTGKSELTELSK